MNLAGSLLAPGYALDLAAEGAARLTLSVKTYPGLAALIEREFRGGRGCARRTLRPRSGRRRGGRSSTAGRDLEAYDASSTISSPIRAPRS